MTDERAIEILDPGHREHYDGLDEVNEACRLGMDALREHIKRNRGCWLCTIDGVPAKKLVLAETCGDANFCPICGRKLPQQPKREEKV